MPDLSLVSFRYTNYRGVKGIRRARPIRIWFGSTAYHPEPQWLLEAFDLDRQETRDFALADISDWMFVETSKDDKMGSVAEILSRPSSSPDDKPPENVTTLLVKSEPGETITAAAWRTINLRCSDPRIGGLIFNGVEVFLDDASYASRTNADIMQDLVSAYLNHANSPPA